MKRDGHASKHDHKERLLPLEYKPRERVRDKRTRDQRDDERYRNDKNTIAQIAKERALGKDFDIIPQIEALWQAKYAAAEQLLLFFE